MLTLTTFKLLKTKEDTNTCTLYKSIEGVEGLENYRTGGYHPIQIGDRFHGRYRVVDKLGHGSYSTV